MKTLFKKIKENPLKLLMITTLIYPVIPLALLAVWGNIIVLSIYFGRHNNTFSIIEALWMVLALLLYSGGPIGLIAGIYALLNKLSKKVFWFFLYGLISYAFVAVIVIAGSIAKLNIFSFLHAAYLLMTLVVITRVIVDMYGNVFHKKTTKSEVA